MNKKILKAQKLIDFAVCLIQLDHGFIVEVTHLDSMDWEVSPIIGDLEQAEKWFNDEVENYG